MKQKPVKIDEDLHEKLRDIQERDGVPMAESVRRAIREWLAKRDEDGRKPNEQAQRIQL